ncbi:MAG: N-acetylmuramoyl-L-alanine amidase [Thermomicrobiales bacterium]
MIDPAQVLLEGPATATAAQARAYARARGARRLEAVDTFITELWALGTMAGYDPAVVFAQFCDETGVGTSAAWQNRLNPGAIGITDGADAGIAFRDGTDAARAMLVHLSVFVRGYDPALWRWIALDPRYLEPLKLGFGATVRQLDDLGGGRWASNPRYADQIASHLAAIRETDGGAPARPADGAQAAPPPGIVWVGTPNFHPRPPGTAPEAIVFHVTDDLVFANVRDWFRRPESGASSHFVVERDGSIFQFVSTLNAAWTNGAIAEPRTDLPWLREAVRRCSPNTGGNLNNYTVTIECMGRPGMAFPAAQIARVTDLARYLLARYPAILPRRDRMLRHSDIDGVNRSYCPGPTFPLAEIIAAAGGTV